MKSKLTFAGGAGTVTGAHFLLETGGKKILIDCGLLQGGGAYGKDENYEAFPYDPSHIDILFLTHAHADHIGRVPKLVKDGFRGVIYSTTATKDLSAVMFEDALRILRQEAQKRETTPLYESVDVQTALSLWEVRAYHDRFDIGDGITVQFLDAGHILGAAMIEFIRNDVKFVATGDLGNSPAPLLKDTEAVRGAHYLLIESVYGDRVHEDRSDRVQLLQQALTDAAREGKTLLIPSFAIQRTQLLLYEINKMIEAQDVPEIPVYLDAPLASAVTDVYRKYTHLFNDNVQQEIAAGDDIFNFPRFVTIDTPQASKELLSIPGPKVIIAGSGMSTGGRVLMHETSILGDENAIILFVGYQGVGTLGRRIQDGASVVTINNKKIRVRAEKRTIRGFSAHKDREGLMAFVAESKDSLQEVFVVMGEPKSSLFLVQRLRDFLGVMATAPDVGAVVSLDF
tara:strand:+ start:2725 stop:4089 length:1365 start_codon:yes stop_codon:yes gene_type:complete